MSSYPGVEEHRCINCKRMRILKFLHLTTEGYRCNVCKCRKNNLKPTRYTLEE